MDKWFEFPASIDIPLAEWIDTIVDWVTINWATSSWVFRSEIRSHGYGVLRLTRIGLTLSEADFTVM